jgi:hypothetical protein
VRQLIFCHPNGRFVGMASPAAVIDGLSSNFPLLDEFNHRRRQTNASADTERETDRQVSIWNTLVGEKLGGDERQAKVGVRTQLLDRWLGERLITRCIQVDRQGLSMTQVQQIVDSLLPDVPVERVVDDTPAPGFALQVIDSDAFALELACEWVRADLPRTPVH